MNIQELSKHYAKRPQVAALAKAVKEGKQNVFLEGLLASSAPLLFSSLAQQCSPVIFFILQDAEEAGYFYHDLTQLMGTERVLFFPSSYRRSVKYAQRDPANEILRTEVLTEVSEKLRVNSDKFPAGVPVGEGMAAANSSLFTSHFSLTKYCGIDGLPGEDGGIRLVRDSILDASYIYPTHGDKIIELAINILEGKPYEKETLLQSALVTRDNAKVLLMQSEEMMRQAEYLDQLHSRADTYLKELATQHVVNWMSMGVILLLVVTIVLFYLYHLRNLKLQQERVVSTLWNMEIEPAPVADETKEHTADSSADEKPSVVAESAFLTRFREVVEARMEDSEVSVDDLAAEMNLSRVQLYRKIKTITGSSPVELLRTTRLKRAYQMLLTTDKSVSEVAYAVGFTAPSYFSKCFKEEYGMVPGDIRK